MKNTDRFKGIYEMYIKSIGTKPKDVNMQPVGLGTTWIFDRLCPEIFMDID